MHHMDSWLIAIRTGMRVVHYRSSINCSLQLLKCSRYFITFKNDIKKWLHGLVFWLFSLTSLNLMFFNLRGSLHLRGHLTIFGDIFSHHNWGRGATGSSWQRPGMLPGILKCTGQHPTTKSYLAQNVCSAEVEKPWTR